METSDSPMPDCKNPLKRCFTDMNSSSDPSPRLNGLDRAFDSAPQQPASSSSTKDFIPRNYQLKVFEVATKRNTVAVLETGAGKTMIAVMLIKDIGQAIKSSGINKLILFLAPTVSLVDQQSEEIKKYTNFEVGVYYGSKGVDEWTLECWQREIEKHDVLVMTPQILLDALRNAFLNLELVSLMIIDECHRATGNHPYTKIMKEFYHKLCNKPKVFGMTASPVVRKGVSSAMDCESQISELENILDSQIYTIEDRTEMDVYVHSARETCRFYDKVGFCCLDLKAKIEALWTKFDALMMNMQASTQNGYKDKADKLTIVRKLLSKDHSKILKCLEDLGLFCAYEAIKVCLDVASDSNEECEIYRVISLQRKYFLEEVLCLLGDSLPQGDYFTLNFGFDFLKAVDLGYISPKVHELLQILLSFGGDEQVLCLIFVDRIITAKVIERFVRKAAFLSHFTVSYLTGTNAAVDGLAPQLQKKTLESFRSGKVNLLFATEVLEEGIHVPNCSVVIRFDLPKTVRSYIQSRGRARQNDSQFIIFLERGNTKQRDQLFDIIRSEWSMTESAINRDPDIRTLKACTIKEMNMYVVDVTGASVTADSSISLIYRYCAKLPGDRYYTPKPTFEFEQFGQSCQCKMKLPPSAAFQEVVGPVCRGEQLAKKLACLEACKKLHRLGGLDDHLLPSTEKPEENSLVVKSKRTSAGAGTTKRKELHGSTSIHALSGTWGEKLDGATFHAYMFDFSCNIASEIYSRFVLLIESKLDDDVGNIDVDLYLVRKMVKSSVSTCGQLHLDAEQMVKARTFQELFFNGLFGKLFNGSKSSGKPREFLLNNETGSLWCLSNMYLLLPLDMSSTPSDESCRINWKGIDACTSVVEFLKSHSFLQKHCDGVREQPPPPCRGVSSVTEGNGDNTINFANTLVDGKNPKNMVVVAIHTGRIYSVLELASGLSAESPFETDDYSSYAEYFNKKYGIVLKHPGKSLLKLKQSHNPHNLLVNFSDEGALKNGVVVAKQRQYVHIPPELLVSVDIPVHVLKSLYLLPSLMHRLESLMLASQLRHEIGCHVPNIHIPSSLILEAITTLRCCETFSMERLELLGDSVLKYAVSCCLFLTCPEKNEGQLSDQRSWAVCNSTLYTLGTGCKLQEYIRDDPFDPRRWVAPGQQSLRPVPCKCGVDTLEVPLDAKFQTEDIKVKVGERCDLGHRWMGSKTISDCVEAIIGAYYVSGGLVAALHVMKWFGIHIELDPSLAVEAINRASLHSYIPKEDEINSLESKLGYTFFFKFLLQEAMTHASMQKQGANYNYQRLEFLGDAVLDLLITWHLYQSHKDVDPGELTDLRSASVNNQNFAQVAVRQNLYKHLQHCSTILLSQITDYVESFCLSDDATKMAQGTEGPKALGDMVESIAGAILIDTKLNLDEVWRIFKPLLSPIVTPDKLQLPPFRELTELCSSLGYFVKENCIYKGDIVHAELKLQLNDVLLVGEGNERTAKAAKGKAASYLLKELEHRGMAYSRGGSKRRKLDSNYVCFGDTTSTDFANESSYGLTDNKKHKKMSNETDAASHGFPSIPRDGPTAIESINMKKGGPRNTLYELCRKVQWPMPMFDTEENKSRKAIVFGEGAERREGFSSFVSKITLNIPQYGTVECTGDPRADKKSSFDSAALVMLLELRDRGQLTIGN